MVKITYENPYDELEKLVLQRQVLTNRHDQLYMMTRDGAMDSSPVITLTISGSHSLIKSTHRVIICKTLKYLYTQYSRRMERIEGKIKNCLEKINAYEHDNDSRKNPGTESTAEEAAN
ncbi:MAG: hypothetical protein ACO1PI_09340 [Bacteroidota bacterium]